MNAEFEDNHFWSAFTRALQADLRERSEISSARECRFKTLSLAKSKSQRVAI